MDWVSAPLSFHQGLQCSLRINQPSGTEIHHNLENSTCDLLGNPIFVVSICMGRSTRIQRVKKRLNAYVITECFKFQTLVDCQYQPRSDCL